MIFLTIDDFKHLVRDPVLAAIIDDDHGLLAKAELSMLEQVQSYLRHRYDVANIFNRSGNDRNQWLLTVCVDIMLYHLHSRTNPRQIPDLRIERYESALEWLKSVAAGKLSPDFPAISPTEDAPTGQLTYIGETKRQNRY